MSQYEKLLLAILSRTKDKNLLFSDLRLVLSEDDNTYIAEMPELSGCMADGPTAAEALHNVELIAQEWIEAARELGRPVPVPKGRLKYA